MPPMIRMVFPERVSSTENSAVFGKWLPARGVCWRGGVATAVAPAARADVPPLVDGAWLLVAVFFLDAIVLLLRVIGLTGQLDDRPTLTMRGSCHAGLRVDGYGESDFTQ